MVEIVEVHWSYFAQNYFFRTGIGRGLVYLEERFHFAFLVTSKPTYDLPLWYVESTELHKNS